MATFQGPPPITYTNVAVPTSLDDATGINATDTTVVVDDGSTYPAADFTIQMDDEVMFVESRSGNTLTIYTTPDGRGWDGTTAAIHSDNAPVKLVQGAETSLSVPRNSWLDRLFRRPTDEVAHADDDEFDKDTTGDWTEIDPTGTTTWIIGGHRMTVTAFSQAANDIGAIVKALTPTVAPVTIEAPMLHFLTDQSFNMAGILFTDGTAVTSNAVAVIHYSTTGTDILQIWTGTIQNMNVNEGALWVASGDHGGGFTRDLWVRLVWTATNTFRAAFSIDDGVQWEDYGLGTIAETITPTHIGFFASVWGGGVNPAHAAWDAIRVFEIDRT